MRPENERLQERAEEVRRDFSGEIRTDRFTCAPYSTDASIPAIRKAPPEAGIVASGTSCRRQIIQGTGRKARHIAGIPANALAE
jgi:hypothetical protein